MVVVSSCELVLRVRVLDFACLFVRVPALAACGDCISPGAGGFANE